MCKRVNVVEVLLQIKRNDEKHRRDVFFTVINILMDKLG